MRNFSLSFCLIVTLAMALVCGVSAQDATKKTKKVLHFSECAGFVHSPVKSVDDQPCLADKALTELCKGAGIEIVCTKDARIFEGDIASFDVFIFQTSGDLFKGDKDHPEWALTEKGWKNLLGAIRSGKGLLGVHAASDTCRTGGDKFENSAPEKVTDYIKLLGAEFTGHAKSQDATVTVIEPTQIDWLKAKGPSFKLFEEWYAQKNFAKDIHVFALLETDGMEGDMYNRPPYPMIWGRTEGKGRVFYSALGHHDDFWKNPDRMNLMLELIRCASGEKKVDLTPNIDVATPGASILKK